MLNNILPYLLLTVFSAFVFLFKIVQTTLAITDFDKIHDDCTGHISIQSWLTISGICGTIVFAYHLINLIVSEYHTNTENFYSLLEESLDKSIMEYITKIIISVTLVYQLIWMVLGFYIFFYSCTDIYSGEISKLMNSAIFVDLFQLIIMISLVVYNYKTKQVRDKFMSLVVDEI